MTACAVCGKEFTPAKSGHLCCSPKCNNEYRAKNMGNIQKQAVETIPRESQNMTARRDSRARGNFRDNRSGGGRGGGYRDSRRPITESLGADLTRTTFFGKPDACGRKHLSEKVFVDVPDRIARLFGDAGLSQTSIRRVFMELKRAEKLARTDSEFDFRSFYVNLENKIKSNSNRYSDTGNPVCPRILYSLFEKHSAAATSSKDEFLGFIEFVTSILVCMKTK
ncbi:MAG: recombination protein NinG [Planctomycetes bacterium]|nr:recombination protein NinG [Planctomycetota bacterium]